MHEFPGHLHSQKCRGKALLICTWHLVLVSTNMHTHDCHNMLESELKHALPEQLSGIATAAPELHL